MRKIILTMALLLDKLRIKDSAKLSTVKDRPNMTFDEWMETGRFCFRKDFEQDNPNENLHVDCTDVVIYYGGAYIQVLKSGDFYMNAETKSKFLHEIEKEVWQNKSILFN
jgi:hypothetical protein